jgi:hypothetical protein
MGTPISISLYICSSIFLPAGLLAPSHMIPTPSAVGMPDLSIKAIWVQKAAISLDESISLFFTSLI